ncbi:MAG TPA: lysophospholipid acyltransferase family protein [Acidimicrobiia bacterium]|nr:lysophospholipid acyltransferase family protein [Acidimicrobiia bacterium]
MKRILAWITTIPFLLSFGVVLVIFDLAGRAVRPFSLRAFEYVMAALQRTLTALFLICGTRVHIERPDTIRPRTGYAIISNHQSLFDIAIIGGMLFTNFPKYVAKKELGKGIPSISLNLKRGGNALIDRDDRRQAIRAIRDMARTAQNRNVSVVIFPEGTRSRDGALGEFKRAGSIALLRQAESLPVVPMAIDGAWKLLRHNMKPVPFGTTVRVRFGDPVERFPDDGEAMLVHAEKFITAALEEWRRPG